MSAVFVTRGMGIRIPAGGLTISVGPDGSLDSSIRVEVSLDMCPYWLEIAIGHLQRAADARAGVARSRAETDEGLVGSSLEQEFAAGMQAITSAAIALDALYASVRERISIPQTVVDTWRAKRTARHRQVAEVFRRAFRVRGKGFTNLASILAELYRFRDMAIHPASRFSEPVFHPLLGTGTEWRFVSFGYESAQTAVRAALAIVVQLVEIPRDKTGPLADYCAGLSKRVTPLVGTWRAQFGALLDNAAEQ